MPNLLDLENYSEKGWAMNVMCTKMGDLEHWEGGVEVSYAVPGGLGWQKHHH